MSAALTVHATCVVIGEAGVLLRGPSGSGKSTLAIELITLASAWGHFAGLVCDDRVRLEARHGRVVARAVAAIEGLVELRGAGPVTIPHEPAAVLRLVVDLGGEPSDRLPEAEARRVNLADVTLPGIRLHGRQGAAAILLALRCRHDTPMTVP